MSDLAGHGVGTDAGHDYVLDLKKIPNVDLKLYDTDDACLHDLEAGRIDYAALDGTTIACVLLQNPGAETRQVPIKTNTQYPALSRKGRAVMGMNMENTDLFDAVNDGVEWSWATKTNTACLARDGLTNPTSMVPAPNDPRIGVDRSADGAVLGPTAHQSKDYSSYFA